MWREVSHLDSACAIGLLRRRDGVREVRGAAAGVGLSSATRGALTGRQSHDRRLVRGSGWTDCRLHLRERGRLDLVDAVIALRMYGRLLQDLFLVLSARFDRTPREQLAASQDFRHGSRLLWNFLVIPDWPWPG